MTVSRFQEDLTDYFEQFRQALATDKGDWVVKGFIDVYRNIYTISLDAKVVSKIIELMLFPLVARFASEHKLRMVLCEQQNHYPDVTLITNQGIKIALDLKSTYRTDDKTANGFTLGAFTGYFRQRKSTKNITFPYADYAAHFVLGTIYSRGEDSGDERRVYRLKDLRTIASVARDFAFLLQEKWRIAVDRPGSGNTKNIGSVRNITALVEGRGPFAALGRKTFDDYWMNYLTQDMARAIDSSVPYRNLKEFRKWREKR